jgi:hypothetical protein
MESTFMIHPRLRDILRSQGSLWKSGRSGTVQSRTFWNKYLHLVEPLMDIFPYGAAARRKTKAADVALMGLFQSLGDNCEFGLVQRQLGAEPLGLFRYAHTMIDGLIAALESRFVALESPENIEVKYCKYPNGDFEYITSVPQYQFNSHSGLQSNTMNDDKLRGKEIKRLNFLARKLIEEAETGTKIFVYKSNAPIVEQRIEDLHRAIGRYGPAWLLWVTPATADWPAGRVEEVSERLLRGAIERFAPYESAGDFSLQGWRTICRNAYDLWVARHPTRA